MLCLYQVQILHASALGYPRPHTFHLGRTDLINSLVGVAKGHMAARSEALQLYRAILTRGKALRYTDVDYFRRQVRQEFRKRVESTDSTEIEFQIEVMSTVTVHMPQLPDHIPWPRPSTPVLSLAVLYTANNKCCYVCDLRPQPNLVLVTTATNFPPGGARKLLVQGPCMYMLHILCVVSDHSYPSKSTYANVVIATILMCYLHSNRFFHHFWATRRLALFPSHVGREPFTWPGNQATWGLQVQ